jgi:hypothetical protein
MRYSILFTIAAVAALTASTAMADESGKVQPKSGQVQSAPISDAGNESVPFKLGMLFDVSVPSGGALGIEARLPHVPWFKVGLAGTYTLAPGIRGNILFDPIKFPVAPLLNVDVGHQFPFTVPSVSNSPSIDFTYCDLQGGIGFGSRDGFRFMLMGGMSYLYGGAHGFQGLLTQVNGLTVADPTFNGWVPNVKLGFSLLF